MEKLAKLDHPVAVEIRRLLAENPSRKWSADLVRAMAAIALHAQAGETLASRVFSARHLGNSKRLESLRPTLERLLGPLEALGIREGAALTLVGGAGILHIGVTALDLSALRPFIGLSREGVLKDLDRIEFPQRGLLVIENLAPFEACCKGELPNLEETLFLWAAGYPGRSIKAIVNRASEAGVPLRIWADLDLDGIRIARLISSWVAKPPCPYRMAPDDVNNAPVELPLSPRAIAAITADLAEYPDTLLSETLRALEAKGIWVEQEAWLGIRQANQRNRK